jgi:hypothetical protein
MALSPAGKRSVFDIRTQNTYGDHFAEENMMFRATRPDVVNDVVSLLYANNESKGVSNFKEASANPFDDPFSTLFNDVTPGQGAASGAGAGAGVGAGDAAADADASLAASADQSAVDSGSSECRCGVCVCVCARAPMPRRAR